MKKAIFSLALLFVATMTFAQFPVAESLKTDEGWVTEKAMLHNSIEMLNDMEFTIQRDRGTGTLVLTVKQRLNREGIEVMKNYVNEYYNKQSDDKSDRYNASAPDILNTKKGCTMRFYRAY